MQKQADIAISASRLAKRYRLGVIGARTFRDSVEEWFQQIRARLGSVGKPCMERSRLGANRDAREEANRQNHENPSEIWALNDVTFDVRRGEVLGIVGKNGAGKSTLLKILTRITEPTRGKAVLRGRVGSLLEVGTGFHPELTGRENVYLNGTILGMKKQEIDRKFDEIVEFSGIEQFIDTPVKRYSSGMYVRLGFAVAAHLEPEILLVDEVLAVGDVAFQKKCLGKMQDVAGSGRTVLFVSHNMASVLSLCTRACVLENGRMTYIGDTREAVSHYLEAFRDKGDRDLRNRADRQGDGRIRTVAFRAEGRTSGSAPVWGEEARFVVQCEGETGLSGIHFSIGVYDSVGGGVLYASNDLSGDEMWFSREGCFVCTFPNLLLLPGSYTVNLYCTVKGVLADWVMEAASLTVFEGDFYGTGKKPPTGYGAVSVPQYWRNE